MKAKWSVMVVHQDAEAREAAVAFCDALVRKFWAECDFEVSWCPFDGLEETSAAVDAARKASAAELVVVVTGIKEEIPVPVKGWMEYWVAQRGDREGLLVGLSAPWPAHEIELPEAHTYLREVAHRAGMDYLTELPQSLTYPIPESFESYIERAGQVTSVLDEILHFPPRPPQLPPSGR